MPKPPAPSPKPTPASATVTLSPRGLARLKSGHPWVYKSDIAAQNAEPGATVAVLDQRGKFHGTALYSSASQIAIRMISRETTSRDAVPDLPSLIAQRIREAIAYRKTYVQNTNACRVVFSEADFLPGLIVDRYNDVLSLQILTQAMDAEPVRGAIVETLIAELKPEGILERVDPRIRELEQLPPRDSALLWGKKSSTIITMNVVPEGPSTELKAQSPKPNDQRRTTNAGVSFHYSGLEGQKTGAFLDQRENYAAAARYAHGNALDIFCYHGGFALHLAPVCTSVAGVDSSRPALEVAEKNATLNHHDLDWIEANAFDLLRDYADAGNKYQTIVLDPPAFAKSKRDLHKALSGYKELNLRALKMLQPGGILISCSCSFHVSSQDFQETIASAARDAHKSLRVLEFRGATQDHPVLLNVPETAYLKCLIFHVSN
ncbi:MAG TPA: class I SAM-dependent rRNA methyltransferase [Terriglobales bacterium]|nr:class I SAM-dependent rRNA methyltransferase [Terriglobales bacterium]